MFVENTVDINKLINKKDLDDSEIENLSEYVNNSFYDIDEDIRNNLLINLCNSPIGSGNTASAIIENIKEISEEAKNALFILAQNPQASKNVAVILQYKYYTLPAEYRNNLLKNIAINTESIIPIAHIINEAFKRIPDELRNNLILELCNYKEAEFYRLKVLKFNYDHIPEYIREKLLINLSTMEKINKPVSFIVREKVKTISGDALGQILINLLSQKEYTKYITYITRDYFYLISEKYRNAVMDKLAEKDENFKTVMYILIRGYNKYLDKDYCNKIIKDFIKNKSAIWWVVGFLIKNFDSMDSDLRNSILIDISENTDVKDSIVHIINNKNDKIPTEIKDFLHRKLDIN